MDWKAFFDRLGLNGTRWQWRIYRWKNRWADWRTRSSGQRRQWVYASKVCPSCRALVAREEATCPSCHAPVGSWTEQAAGRAARSLIPEGVIVTPALLAANIVVAIMTMLKPGSLDWKELLNAGFIRGELLKAGQWWRLLSYGFLHANLIHILFNMIALMQFGPILEGSIGRRRYFSMYVITLAVAGAATAFLRDGPNGGSIGASGAIFGLVGFGLTYARTLGDFHFYQVFRSVAIQAFIFGVYIQVVGSIGIDNIAHIGGFAAGALLGWGMGYERRHIESVGSSRRMEGLWTMLAMACALWCLASLGGMFVEFVHRIS